MSRVLAVIPARHDATRFPGKPLALINGREMILRVAERAARCEKIDDVLVAADDERILRVVRDGGFKGVMTSRSHASGMDRVAEAARDSDAEIVVNLQGDEPLMDPPSVDRAIEPLLSDAALNVSTLATPITDLKAFNDPNVVKVVFDDFHNALYFSRAPIPHNRDGRPSAPMFKHLGLYVYRREFLIKFSRMKPGVLEQTEMLEQLRILQNGVKIRVVPTDKDSVGVDTPDDLKRAEAMLDA